MQVINALKKRTSTRAFLKTPVPADVLKSIFSQAQQAPSNCNVQPWQTLVVSADKKEQIKCELVKVVMSGATPNPDFNWQAQYQGVHRDRQFGSANVLYSSMGITRDDKKSRQLAMLRNWQFFDAPHVAFFTMDKYLNIMGAVDMGIYAQSLALLLNENGISSCLQGALGQFPDPIKQALNIPEERGILFGMSFGYADDTAAVNTTRTEREKLETAVEFFQ